MYWRFLREGETNHNEFNIWPIMKSKTMREYYKNNIKLSTEAIISIIVNSCTSMYEKIEYLNNFANYCKNKNKKYTEDEKLVEDLIGVYYFAKMIFEIPELDFPNDTVIYSLRCSRFMCNDFEEYKWSNNDTIHLFDEYQPCAQTEIFNNISGIINSILQNKNTYDIFYIDAFIIDENGNSTLICKYDAKFIGDNICIDLVSINSAIYNYDNSFGLNSFYIPCDNKNIYCTIDIPWIKQSIKGKIKKELADTWYYQLMPLDSKTNDFNDSYIWLNKIRINDCSNRFSIFDFIELEEK